LGGQDAALPGFDLFGCFKVDIDHFSVLLGGSLGNRKPADEYRRARGGFIMLLA